MSNIQRDRYPGDLEERLAQADRLDEAGDYAGSEEIYSHVILQAPSLPFAYAKRGYARERQKKYRSAAEDYSMAIAKKPDSPVTTWRRALCFEHLDRLEEAKADYRRYMELKGPDAEALFALSLINSFQRQDREALNLCEQAALLAPEDETIQRRLAKLKERQFDAP
ncbi:tetratricopeptide repeat protein [Roseateles sp.]|uniref:tetratricopeptide repeat protein n=1 Tax=Roseateles sp. TaxID=1971397 RepID=UPI0031E310DB